MASESGVSSHASQLWGTAAFKGCRFCRRDRTCPNPVIPIRDEKPLLQFKSDRHSECLPCVGKLRRCNPLLTTAESKSTFAKKLADDDNAYLQHMRELAAYEEKLQQPVKKRRTSGGTTEQAPEEFMDDREANITMSKECGVETRQNLGVLWPPAIYKTHVGSEPKPDQLSKITIGDCQIVGVLRDAAHGRPTGTYEVTDFKRAYGSNVLTAASTSTALADDEVENTWKQVQKCSAVGVTEVEKDGEKHMYLDAASATKRARDEFDDLLDFGPLVSNGSGGPPPKAPRNNRGGGGPKTGKEPKAKQSSQAGGGGGEAAKPVSKQMKEIQNSERILLECRQAVDNLKSDDGLEIVKPKAISSLCDRLKNRLTPAMCAIYTQGYDASDTSAGQMQGMECLENLRTYSRLLNGVQDLVASLHDTKVAGEELFAKIKSSQSSEFTPPGKVFELALQREVDAAASEKQYKRVMELLGDKGGCFNLSILPSEDLRKKFQEREITRLCVSLLRESDKVAEVDNLLKVALDGTTALPLDSNMRKEFELLKPLLAPMNNEVSIDLLEKTSARFYDDKQLKLHKVMVNFPTGLQILEGVAAALVARKKDAELEVKLLQIGPLAVAPSVATDASLRDMFIDGEDLRKVYKTYLEVSEKASDAFKAANAAEMGRALGVVKEFADQIENKIRADWNSLAESCFKAFAAHVKDLNTGIKLRKDISDEDIAEFLKLAESMLQMPQPDEFLTGLKAAKDLSTMSAACSELGNFANVIKLTVPTLLDGNSLDPANSDDNLAALISILMSPSDTLKDLSGFSEFLDAATTRLLGMLQKSLDAILRPLLAKHMAARQVLSFMGGAGPGLEACDLVAESEQEAAATASAAKQCEQVLKNFSGLIHRILPEFGAAFSAPASAEGDGPDGDDESGLASATLEVWMVCTLPRAWKVLSSCKACLLLEVDLIADPKASSQKYEEFTKMVSTAHAELEEWRSLVQSLDLEGQSDVTRVFVANKFVIVAEKYICGAAAGVVKSVVMLQVQSFSEMNSLLIDQDLAKTDSLIDDGCSDTNMTKLLEIAQCKSSKNLHSLIKHIEFLNEVFSALSGLKQLKSEGLAASQTAVQDSMAALLEEANIKKAKALNCSLATIQALWRPLKAGETRGQLARRARVMCTTRGIKLAPNLELFLGQKAAIPDKQVETKSDGKVSGN